MAPLKKGRELTKQVRRVGGRVKARAGGFAQMSATKALDVFREESRVKGIVNHRGDLSGATGLVKVRYVSRSREDEWVDRTSVDNLDALMDRYRAQRTSKRQRQLKALLPPGSPLNMGTLALLSCELCAKVLSHLPFLSEHMGQLRLVSSAFCRPGVDGMVLVDRAAEMRIALSKPLWPLWLRQPSRSKPELQRAVPVVKEEEGGTGAGVGASAAVLANALAQVKQEVVERSEPRPTPASQNTSWRRNFCMREKLRFADIVLSKRTLLWTEVTNFGDLDIGQDEHEGLGAAHRTDFESWKSAGTNPMHYMNMEDAVEKARPHGLYAERLKSLGASYRPTKLPGGGHVSSVVAATTCVTFEDDDRSRSVEGYALCGGEPMTSGLHAAEFHLVTEDHASVGVAPPDVITTLNAREPNRGGGREIMAAYCEGLPRRRYDDPRESGQGGDVLGMLLDLDAGTLTCFLNGKLETALPVTRNVEQGQLRGPLCWCANVWGSMGE